MFLKLYLNHLRCCHQGYELRIIFQAALTARPIRCFMNSLFLQNSLPLAKESNSLILI